MVENYKAKTLNYKTNFIPEEGSAVFGFIKANVNDEFIDIKKQSEEQQRLIQIKKDYELALKLQNEENDNIINNNNIINVNNNFNHHNINRINTERNIQRKNNNLNLNSNRNNILNDNKNNKPKNLKINNIHRNRNNLRINMNDISNLKINTMREKEQNNIDNNNDFCLLTYNENDSKKNNSPNFFKEKNIIKVKKNIELKKKTNNKYNMDYCIICLENFKNGEKLRKLSCCHIFHIKCINDWFRKKKSCPVDNKENLKVIEIIY